MPGSAPQTVLERAYAAVSADAIYHYAATSQELEGPQRRPLADTRSAREGWIDPATGEIHEISRERRRVGERREAPRDVHGVQQLAAALRRAAGGRRVRPGHHGRAARADALLPRRRPARRGRGDLRRAARYAGWSRRTRRRHGARRSSSMPRPIYRCCFSTRPATTSARARRSRRASASSRSATSASSVCPADTDRAVLEMRPHPGARPSQQPRPAIAPASG